MTLKNHSAGLQDFLRVLPQYLIPQHTISRIVYRLCRCEWPPFKNFMIQSFIKCFDVDMRLSVHPDADAYKHFNHFFTRALKPSVRPIAGDVKTIVCPVDGRISQIGRIHSRDIIQAKNRSYDLDTLLAGDHEMAAMFENGRFATFYLAPRDYHRIHMPIDGRLVRMIHVPGRLFAVNIHTARVVNRLFARNERVISLFETPVGPMAIIMVGSLNVGGMETVWAGEITPARKREITTVSYKGGEKEVRLKRGHEMGRFNMGSTVIVIFSGDRIRWLPETDVDHTVIVGMPLGIINAD
jgi:phosphatidylserine decarboxylase precursor